MERTSPPERHPEEACRQAVAEIQRLAIPFAAQMLFRRYPYTRQLGKQERLRGPELRSKLFRRRDSVTHRAAAVDWHVHWLFALYNQRTGLANQTDVMFDSAQSMPLLLRTITDMLFIFDDIMLNAVSLLDYQAQFLALAISGRGVPRWDALVKRVKKTAAPDTYGEDLAATIIRLDEAWVRRLVDRRNYIAHQSASTAAGAKHLHIDQLMTTMSIELPSDAKSLLVAMGLPSGEDDLLYGAQHIAATALRGCAELLAVATTAQKLRADWVPVASL